MSCIERRDVSVKYCVAFDGLLFVVFSRYKTFSSCTRSVRSPSCRIKGSVTVTFSFIVYISKI